MRRRAHSSRGRGDATRPSRLLACWFSRQVARPGIYRVRMGYARLRFAFAETHVLVSVAMSLVFVVRIGAGESASVAQGGRRRGVLVRQKSVHRLAERAAIVVRARYRGCAAC